MLETAWESRWPPIKKKITLNSDLWQETKVSDKSFLFVEIELDPYRSYNRSKRSGLNTSK